MFSLLLILLILLFIIHYIINCNENAKLLRKIPNMKFSFIVGHAPEIFVHPVKLFSLGREWASTFKGIYSFYAFGRGCVNIYNPQDIEIIMSGMKFNEKSIIYNLLKPWLKQGLLLSKGKKWQTRRKILTPAFHFNILQKFLTIFIENSERLVDVFEKSQGETLDIVPVLSDCTLDTICETAMGTRLDENRSTGKDYKEAIVNLVKIIYNRFINVFYHSNHIFNATNLSKKQNEYISIMHKFTNNVILSRKVQLENNEMESDKDAGEDTFIYKKRRAAMLDLLIAAEQEGLIDTNGIHEEVDTFMFEGHDTTSSGLTYCLLMLAEHPCVQDKIVEELNKIFGTSSRVPTGADLLKMQYLECCIKESLRLYPPVPFISRRITEPVKLSNFDVPKGTMCHIHIYDLHRLESTFKNALQYDPDRFLPENSSGRPPYTYIPFSAGPRNCIGQKFAMMEIKATIAAILRKFKLVPVTRSRDLKFTADLILRNSEPVYLKFLKRDVTN